MSSEFDDAEYFKSYDPRDEMLGDFMRSDPEPIDVERMTGADFCWMDAGLEQLLVAEMIGYGWLVENLDGSISLTDLGRSFVTSRLERRAIWADDLVRPDAPPLPEMSSRLNVACRASITRAPDNPLWQGYERSLAN